MKGIFQTLGIIAGAVVGAGILLVVVITLAVAVAPGGDGGEGGGSHGAYFTEAYDLAYYDLDDGGSLADIEGACTSMVYAAPGTPSDAEYDDWNGGCRAAVADIAAERG